MPADAIETVHPLTASQRGMLFHALAEDRTETFVEQLSWVVRGPLDTGVLRRAWELVVARTPVLRTQVVWEGMDEPLQVVVRDVRPDWREEDWRAVPGHEQDERRRRWSAADRFEGFDIAAPRLVRITVLRLDHDRHRLVWTFHHLVLDGWSMTIVLRDLATTYRALARGDEPRLPRRRPFADYIGWLQHHDTADDRRFWATELGGDGSEAGRPPVTPTLLPVAPARRPSGRHTAAYGQATRSLAEGTSVRLLDRAQEHGVTPSAVVEGAWAVLLHRYTGRDDVVSGVTDSGRGVPLRGIEDAVGMFVTLHPSRSSAAPRDRIWDVVSACHRRRLNRLEHAVLPFDQILASAGLGSGVRLFDSAIVFENYPLDDAVTDWGPALTTSDVEHVGGRANYTFSLYVHPGPVLRLDAVFDADRVADADAVLRHLTRVLEALAEGPADRRLDEVRLTDAAPPPAPGTPGTGPGGPSATGTVDELISAATARSPRALVATGAGGAMTYEELDRRAGALAAAIEGLHRVR